MRDSLPLKKTDPRIADHPIERRGFVRVPLAYAAPSADASQETLDVFYRLLPAYGAGLDDRPKPIIVVMNGGPGVPSSAYRPLEFDYADPKSPKNGLLDRFKYLLQTYRVLLIDQRGTDGQSAPLDMDNPKLVANDVARYFSSDSQARDFAAVIDDVIPRDEPFYVIAQSYGGMPGMQYLGLVERGTARAPKGIAFSSSALPEEDIIEQATARRREQLRLNLELRDTVPGVEQKLLAAQAHLKAIGLSPTLVHGLYTWLGKGVTGTWEPEFVARIDRLLTSTRAQIENDPHDKLGQVHLLNYILSSACFTPGHTDRTMARLTSARVPFEPWMLDENVMLTETGQDGTWREAFVAAMDRHPPASTPMPSLEALRAGIRRTRALFTAADNDAYVPAETFIKTASKFEVPGHTRIQTLPGGHNAIFLEHGHAVFRAWAGGDHQ